MKHYLRQQDKPQLHQCIGKKSKYYLLSYHCGRCVSAWNFEVWCNWPSLQRKAYHIQPAEKFEYLLERSDAIKGIICPFLKTGTVTHLS